MTYPYWRARLFLFGLLALAFSFTLGAFAQLTDGGGKTVDAVPAPSLVPYILTAIPVIVPLLIAWLKLLAPKIPSHYLPIVAPLLGALAAYISSKALGSNINPLVGAALGSTGVGLREIVDQLKQRMAAPAQTTGTSTTPPVAALALLLFFVCLSSSAQDTNVSTLPPGNSAPITIPNLPGNLGTNLTHVANDAVGVFQNFNFKQASAGIVGFKTPDGFGGGIEVHSFSTNTPVQIGFGIFGAQERNTVTKKLEFGFYDGTLNIGVSTVETIPVVNLPLTLRVESGPAFKFAGEGGGTLLEQSAAYGDFNFHLSKNWSLTFGGGLLHCSDPHFVDKAMPMAHGNLNWSF
jgi:hypothetical protein